MKEDASKANMVPDARLRSAQVTTRKVQILPPDEETLAKLGYKQEFKRAFTMFETFGIAFSIVGLFPSIASVLFYAIPNGGAASMVWGWLVASSFILTIGMAMAELASAAPTSGGVSLLTNRTYC